MNKPDLSIRRFLLPPMHPEGLRFVLLAILLTIVLAMLCPELTPLFLLLPYGVFLFFRDPERVSPSDPRTLTSPADGIVCLLTQTPIPAQLETDTTAVWRISVFMSVLDVHVNRLPATGTIIKTHYIPGKFFNASLDKASENNERYLYLMRTENNTQIAFVQIAGLIARRIKCFINTGQTLTRGERFGLIRFGSRVDVYLPPSVEPCVKLGQIMVAGETPIAFS